MTPCPAYYHVTDTTIDGPRVPSDQRGPFGLVEIRLRGPVLWDMVWGRYELKVRDWAGPFDVRDLTPEELTARATEALAAHWRRSPTRAHLDPQDTVELVLRAAGVIPTTPEESTDGTDRLRS